MNENTIEIIKLILQFISIIGVPSILFLIFSKKISKEEIGMDNSVNKATMPMKRADM